jgi:hypothetical protein
MKDQKVATTQSVKSMLESLQVGDTLLVQAVKTVNPEKVQLEFAEKSRSLDSDPGALAALLNASDSRFSSGARRAWKPVQIVDAAKYFDVNFGDDGAWEMGENGKEVLPIGIMNPTMLGYRVRLIIKETITPDEYQAEHVDTSAKRKGAEGAFITHKGHHIFSNTDIVLKKGDEAPEHTLLVADSEEIIERKRIKDEVGL